MCGIVAYIGRPTDRQVAYDLTTSLLIKTEIRGDDAAGFWASDDLPDDQEGGVIFSKAPVKSREFVETEAWKMLKEVDLNLLISHCRKSTVKGSENRNRNNHPFLSSDCRSALVHNGNVPEYDSLNKGYGNQKGYDTISDCDSEILLRMMERGPRYDNDFLKKQLGKLKGDGDKTIDECNNDEIPTWSHTLLGLMDIFARINYGAMAVAIGERWEDGTRALWLFRDRERPLQIVDLRETLNQIYIISEKKIWRDAVESTPTAKKFVKGSTAIIEFPPMYIWLLTYKENDDPKKRFGVRKFRINRQRKHDTTFENERPDDLISPPTRKPIKNITNLTSSDEQDWKSGVKVVEPGKEPVPVKEEVVKTPDPTIITPPAPIGHSGDSVPAPMSDWPAACFPFMHRFLVQTFDTLPGDTEMAPLLLGHQLRETAYNSAKPIPDPAILTAKFDYKDFEDWANLLKKRNKWGDRKRKHGVDKGEAVALWIALRNAREAWIEHTLQSAHKDVVNVDAYDFVSKYFRTATEKGYRPWANDSASEEFNIKITSEHLKTGCAKASKEKGCKDFNDQNTNLSIDDYQYISQILQVDYKWNAQNRRKNGVHVLLWLLLQEAHESWKSLQQSRVESVVEDDYSLLSDASKRPSFEDDEEPAESTDQEVDRPLGQVRTDRMTTVNPINSSRKEVDVDLAERYNDLISKIRLVILSIDKKVSAAIKNKSIPQDLLNQIVDNLNDTNDELTSVDYLAGPDTELPAGREYHGN